MKKLFIILFLSLPLPSCYAVSHPGDGEDASNPNCPGRTYFKEDIPVQPFVGVDVLVVVDNSGSMAQEQEMLRTAFPDLIRDLLDPPVDPATGQRVHAPVRDLHIGVVSTDMGTGGYDVPTCTENLGWGDDGILQHTGHGSGCASAYPNYIEYMISPTDEPDPAVISQKAADFGCIAVLGTDGCGFEQQLEAAHKALIDQSMAGMPNAGFLRQDTILAILLVSDEEDCSVADVTIFDPNQECCLLCYWNKSKLHLVDRYINDFKALRGGTPGGETPADLVVGFIVGVPQGEPACNGNGDEIGGCLDVPAMQETFGPTGDILNYACTYPPDCTPQTNCTTGAFPGRRYVQVAQGLGDNAVVQSVCTDSFVPAVEALTEKLGESIDAKAFHRSLPAENDPGDPTGCRCLATCTILEELGDNRPCPAEKPPWDGNHDTIPDMKIDETTGQEHTLCEIPQAGSITSDCGLPCDSPDATYTKDPSRQGWWYNPYEPNLTPPPPTHPTVHFEGVEPASGSGVSIECCDMP